MSEKPASTRELIPKPELIDRDRLTPLERLERTRPDFEELVTKLVPDIKARRWDALIGDDVSGRVTALLLHGIIARSYREQGHPAPKTYFLALGQDRWHDEDQRSLREYMASGSRPDRALFITDNVGEGTTVMQAQEFLDTLGIANDVASAQAETDVLNHASWPHLHQHPDAQCYGVDDRPRHSETQLLHASSYSRPRWRAAIGVERFGDPTTEALRNHMLRTSNRHDRLPVNHDVVELRQAIDRMADGLYKKIVAGSEPI